MREWVLTEAELAEYATQNGNVSAANLLMLVGADGFDGDFEKTLENLTTILTTN